MGTIGNILTIINKETNLLTDPIKQSLLDSIYNELEWYSIVLKDAKQIKGIPIQVQAK